MFLSFLQIIYAPLTMKIRTSVVAIWDTKVFLSEFLMFAYPNLKSGLHRWSLAMLDGGVHMRQSLRVEMYDHLLRCMDYIVFVAVLSS